MFTPVLNRMPPASRIQSGRMQFSRIKGASTQNLINRGLGLGFLCFFLLSSWAKAEDIQLPHNNASDNSWYSSAVRSIKASSYNLTRFADETYGAMEVRVEGLSNLRPSEFQSLIPKDKSYYWWKNSEASVGAALRQHPLVKSASVLSCGAPLRCVIVKIDERVPKLWVKAEWERDKEVRFLIADDGAVLAVLSADQISADQKITAASKFDRRVLARFTAASIANLPVFDARNLANVSDASQQLFGRAVDLVSIIQEEAAMQVYELKFIGNDEVEVEFETQPYKVVFNIANADDLEILKARVGVQIRRLEKILQAKPLLALRATIINLGLEREAFATLAKGSEVTKSGRS